MVNRFKIIILVSVSILFNTNSATESTDSTQTKLEAIPKPPHIQNQHVNQWENWYANINKFKDDVLGQIDKDMNKIDKQNFVQQPTLEFNQLLTKITSLLTDKKLFMKVKKRNELYKNVFQYYCFTLRFMAIYDTFNSSSNPPPYIRVFEGDINGESVIKYVQDTYLPSKEVFDQVIKLKANQRQWPLWSEYTESKELLEKIHQYKDYSAQKIQWALDWDRIMKPFLAGLLQRTPILNTELHIMKRYLNYTTFVQIHFPTVTSTEVPNQDSGPRKLSQRIDDKFWFYVLAIIQMILLTAYLMYIYQFWPADTDEFDELLFLEIVHEDLVALEKYQQKSMKGKDYLKKIRRKRS